MSKVYLGAVCNVDVMSCWPPVHTWVLTIECANTARHVPGSSGAEKLIGPLHQPAVMPIAIVLATVIVRVKWTCC